MGVAMNNLDSLHGAAKEMFRSGGDQERTASLTVTIISQADSVGTLLF